MKALAAAIAAAAHGCIAAAQSFTIPPEPVDLQAAYCVSILQSRRDMLAAIMRYPQFQAEPVEYQLAISQWHRVAQDGHMRLGGYLAARLQYVDVTGILIASQQGDADWSTARAAAQVPRDLDRKMGRCDDLSWLPY